MTSRATRSPRRRTVIALAVILMVLGAFVIRLVDIQVVNAQTHVDESHALGLASTRTLPGVRGTITDSTGTVLASSVTVYDAQLDPNLIGKLEEAMTEQRKDAPKISWAEASEKIAAIIGKTTVEVRDIVSVAIEADPSSQYAPLARGLTTAQFLELRDLALPYLAMPARTVRVYPDGAAVGNMVGFVDGSGHGTYGIEAMQDECLASVDGERSVRLGHSGIVIPGSERIDPAVNGGSVTLTIDSDLNWYMSQMIAEHATLQGAKGGTVLVVEAKTGKIRAAAEYPALDPNDVDATDPSYWKSQLFSTQFEPGSTFKAVTMATILDAGVSPDTTVSAASRERFPNGASIGDAFSHPTYTYTMTGAMVDSSNVALSKFGTMVDAQTRHDYLQKFGVGEKTGVGFLGEEPGRLNPASGWDNQSLYTTTFGQHFAVTAPQVASAYQTIANGGLQMPLSLVESCTPSDGTVSEAAPPEGTQVISESTAAQVSAMLENVSVQGGLSEAIAIPGYRVASKTGTAQKPGEDGRYKQGVYYTSMVGFAPAEDPEYVVIVTLDEPTRVVGSAATASAFRDAMTHVLKTYRVQPSATPMGEPAPKYK